ncbi:hypothetical protein BU24DRAFT_88451 [Aaosphaeria arxii CBS 175.79]|uniref:Uncharacterized protein n=1 Tax=Aaosphaeria arxii CBS 175.79 TaxID=1450172 RepID=A0A6A5X7Q1_9PLEO|nr:uncharacterized protein BU24DRAFT_88451 [Aaosphaeria arxii CBS 175.79]KAF2008919.1 hypothetical protein BU24DRAFT_88451 [Aaosphaeria arxii CBS 175.79]
MSCLIIYHALPCCHPSPQSHMTPSRSHPHSTLLSSLSLPPCRVASKNKNQNKRRRNSKSRQDGGLTTCPDTPPSPSIFSLPPFSPVFHSSQCSLRHIGQTSCAVNATQMHRIHHYQTRLE